MLRPHLHEKPTDVAAIRMLAELAGRIGRYTDAETLLRRALELAPGFAAGARQSRHRALPPEPAGRGDRRARPAARDDEPDDPGHAQSEGGGARPDRRLSRRRSRSTSRCSPTHPDQPKVWMSYGHVLKTVGRQAGRRSPPIAARIALRRRSAKSWWSLANLKTVPLRRRGYRGDGGGAGRRRDLATRTASTSISRSARRSRIAGSHEPRLRALCRGQSRCAATQIDLRRRRDRALRRPLASRLFTPGLLRRARRARAAPAPDPIFILGMPRAARP